MVKLILLEKWSTIKKAVDCEGTRIATVKVKEDLPFLLQSRSISKEREEEELHHSTTNNVLLKRFHWRWLLILLAAQWYSMCECHSCSSSGHIFYSVIWLQMAKIRDLQDSHCYTYIWSGQESTILSGSGLMGSIQHGLGATDDDVTSRWLADVTMMMVTFTGEHGQMASGLLDDVRTRLSHLGYNWHHC